MAFMRVETLVISGNLMNIKINKIDLPKLVNLTFSFYSFGSVSDVTISSNYYK